jgi:hypothetical protein
LKEQVSSIFPFDVEPCIVFSLLHVALPFLYILSFARYASKHGFSWCLVAGLVMYQVSLFTITLSLGHLGLLAPVYYRTVMVALSGILVLAGAAGAPSLIRAIGAIRYTPTWMDIPVVACVAVLLLNLHRQVVGVDWSLGTGSFDSLGYHIPRALLWSWHGNFEPWRASVFQQIGAAYGGAATLLPLIFLGCGWLGAAWTAAALAVGAATAVFVIGKSFGLSDRAALIAFLTFLSFPAVGLRFDDVSTDIAAAFPVLAAVVFFRTAPTLQEGVFWFLALVGLGAATKQYAAFAVIPIGVALLVPHGKAVFRLRVLRAGIIGGLLASVFVLLSLLPIYKLFGDFAGGSRAWRLSTLRGGYYDVFRTTAFTLVNWAAEPLGVLPIHYRDQVFYALRLDRLYELLWVKPQDWLPHFDQEHTRGGVVPLLALPWLILGVERGYRRIVAALFLLLCVAQFSPLAVNHVGARFAILPLAAFALLWGVRAQTWPLVVSLVVLCSLLAGREYLKVKGESSLLPHYRAEKEPYRDVAALVKDETLLLLAQPLSVDALVAGRLAQTRFQYVSCPLDGDWVRQFQESKQQSRWFMFLVSDQPTVIPGPSFESTLGPPCRAITIDQLKRWLDAAGWKFMLSSFADHELWTTK